MAGIDHIVNEILQEAKTTAEGILQEAQTKADGVRAEAEADGEKTLAKSAEKAEQDAEAYRTRVDSQIDLRKRQSLLAAKQSIIAGILEKVFDKLNTQDDASYFAMIKKLAEKIIRGEEGELLFSAKDKQRLPSGFAETLADLAKSKGGSLTVSEETAQIDSGFVIRYGGIEENCSLKALFNEKQNDLQDIVHRVLW